jgi:hypothetical protein
MRLTLIVISVLLLAASASAQDPGPQARPEQREQSVANEDGGRSYLVLPATGPLPGLIKPGQNGVGEVQQRTIFLGPGWADPLVRAREQRLSGLLGRIRDGAQPDAEPSSSNLSIPFVIEKLDVVGNRTISDLELQRILIDALKESPSIKPDSVYMVFLDPTLRSSLGTLLSDKHFVAYHGFVNFAGQKVHYAVVPFQEDAQTAYQTALRTFIVAALHSEDTQH